MSNLTFNPISAPGETEKTSSSMWSQGEREIKNDLGKDEFLKLLLAQMSNQDPLNNQSDTEFIAQLAQFSALEQMQAMNLNFQNSQAQNMIGKTVMATTHIYNEATQSYEKVDLVGVVTSTANMNGKTYVEVNGVFVDPSSITSVFESTESGILNGSSMIGKYVKASYYDEENKKWTEITGQVEQIKAENNYFYAMVGDKQILLGNISVVSDKPIPETPPAETGGGEEGGGENAGENTNP